MSVHLGVIVCLDYDCRDIILTPKNIVQVGMEQEM